MGSRMVTFRSLNNPHSHWQSTNSALGLTCDSHSESFGGLNSSSVTSSPKASMDSSDSSSSKPKESSSLSSPQGSSSEAPKPSSLSSPKKSSSSPLKICKKNRQKTLFSAQCTKITKKCRILILAFSI